MQRQPKSIQINLQKNQDSEKENILSEVNNGNNESNLGNNNMNKERQQKLGGEQSQNDDGILSEQVNENSNNRISPGMLNDVNNFLNSQSNFHKILI